MTRNTKRIFWTVAEWRDVIHRAVELELHSNYTVSQALAQAANEMPENRRRPLKGPSEARRSHLIDFDTLYNEEMARQKRALRREGEAPPPRLVPLQEPPKPKEVPAPALAPEIASTPAPVAPVMAPFSMETLLMEVVLQALESPRGQAALTLAIERAFAPSSSQETQAQPEVFEEPMGLFPPGVVLPPTPEIAQAVVEASAPEPDPYEPPAPYVPLLRATVPAAPPPAQILGRKPKVLVVGLLPIQEQQVMAHLRDDVDLRFLPKNASRAQLKAHARNCDWTLGMKSFMDHQTTDMLRKHANTYISISGASSEITRVLRERLRGMKAQPNF